jgi:hypothetical protein
MVSLYDAVDLMRKISTQRRRDPAAFDTPSELGLA